MSKLEEQKRALLLALRRKQDLAKHTCFNPRDLDSVPTDIQLQALQEINDISQRYVLGGNQSGKTNLGGRECAWIFNGNHPYWKAAQDRPTLQLVVGKTHKIVREEIWEGKIRPFLIDGTYKIYKEGPALTKVTHENGNRIVFFSHKSPEECREAVQAFVADWVWLDEMPKSYKLLTELHTRCQANNAPFLATFTPLLKDAQIKNHIENGDLKYIKKYILKTYDNPVYTEDQLTEMKANHALMSEAERATRTAGEWYAGDRAVYDFDKKRDCLTPEGYHPTWRHMECVDPAAAGKAGYTLLAEEPQTGVWYLVKEDYVEGHAPSQLIEAFDKLSAGVNIVKRVSDSHETWFIKEAQLRQKWYEIPQRKTQRKQELIKNLQEALHKGIIKIAPWCEKAIDEFTTCQWSENSDTIVNSRHYHLLDCLQYAVDTLPAREKIQPVKTVYQMKKEAHRERVAQEAIVARKIKNKSYARIMPKRRR